MIVIIDNLKSTAHAMFPFNCRHMYVHLSFDISAFN